MKQIYCIAISDEAGGGVSWYDTAEQRDAALSTAGEADEVPFTTSVPADATDDEITELADTAAWANNPRIAAAAQ